MPKDSDDIRKIVKDKVKKTGAVRLPKDTPDDVREIIAKYLQPKPEKVARKEVLQDINKIVKAYMKKTPDQKPAEPKPVGADMPEPPIARKPPGKADALETPIAKKPPGKADTLTPEPEVPKKPVGKADTLSGPPRKPPGRATTVTHEPEPPVEKTTTFFDRVKNRMRREGIPLLTKKARNWMREKLETSKVPRQKLIDEGPTDAATFVGNMYFFFYDAKWKKTLPYWDKFPLIFPLELYDDGFLGINLHYLDIRLRLILFDKLQQFATDQKYDYFTKMKLSYGLLASAAKIPEFRPCVKRYLDDHVRSRFLKVHPSEWEIALFLPAQQFQKASAEHVWSESRRKIRATKKKAKEQQQKQPPKQQPPPKPTPAKPMKKRKK